MIDIEHILFVINVAPVSPQRSKEMLEQTITTLFEPDNFSGSKFSGQKLGRITV